jgi:AraC-like DNA-binding protein
MAWLAALIAWATRAGTSRRKLLAAADVTEAELEEPHVAPLVAQELALWEAIGDPAAGLKFGASLHGARAFGIVGYLGRTAKNWSDALDDIARYHPLVGLPSARIWRERGTTAFAFELYPRLAARREPADAAAAALVTAWRLATFQKGSPLEVCLPGRAPQRLAEYRRHFGCPVVFGGHSCAVRWPSQELERPLPTHDLMSRLYFDRVAARALARLPPVGISAAVSREIDRLLERGTPSLAAVSKRLGQGPRTLQRNLAADGSSFDQLLDDTRKRLALQLLHGGHLTLEEVSFRLGFKDSSAFRRAFRRWYRRSPKEERLRRRAQ